MQNKELNKLLYLFLGIFFSVSLLLTAVEAVAFNKSSYDSMFRKYDVANATGLEYEELSEVIGDVLDYLKDDREVLDTTIIKDGLIRPAFGERAITHMLDVKKLFVNGRFIRTISLVAFISLLAFIINKEHNWNVKLTRAFLRIASINLFLVLTLYILMQMDFYKYFTYFHVIFFTNDLWILDPKTELLIQMLPEGLFFDTAIRIATLFIAVNALTGIISYIKNKRKNIKSKVNI